MNWPLARPGTDHFRKAKDVGKSESRGSGVVGSWGVLSSVVGDMSVVAWVLGDVMSLPSG